MPKQSDAQDNIKYVRQNWGKDYKDLPKLDLLAVQKASYKLFQEQGIPEFFKKLLLLMILQERTGHSNSTNTKLVNQLLHQKWLYIKV